MKILRKMCLLALAIIALSSCLSGKCELYPDVFEVIGINEETDTLTLINPYGFMWNMSGIEDYILGDCIAVIMYDGETEWIEDDIIVSANYGGFNFKDDSAW